MRTLLVWIAFHTWTTYVCYGVAPDPTNYCKSRFRCGENPHLRCKYQMVKHSLTCLKIKVETTPTDRQVMLQWLNIHRLRTAAGKLRGLNQTVANMRQLTWDHKLEEFSLVAGTQCANPVKFKKVLSHPCAGTADFKSTFGIHYMIKDFEHINKFIDELNAIEIPKQVINVFAEPNKPPPLKQFETSKDPSAFDPPGYPSHTAVLWANSYKVGCSIISCNCRIYGLVAPETHMVCYFGPGPNVVGQPVFTKQRPCLSCPNGTHCRPKSAYPKLCAREGDHWKAQKIESIDFPPDEDPPRPPHQGFQIGRRKLDTTKKQFSAGIMSTRPAYLLAPLLTAKFL